MPFVLATGHVTPCCLVSESNQREFQKKNSMGNAFSTSIKDIWQKDDYIKYRKMIQNGDVPLQCKECPIFSVK
jgi:radical SAM protein with 4Fe4S-binding SPASM domain